MSYIHEKGVIHLDLKPNNIVCVTRKDDDPRVKIIDFGLARRLHGEDSIPIAMCGTPEFISPEVMRCTMASTASDMWSVGVVVFMLVTGGHSPFYSRNKYKMQRHALRGNYNIEQFPGVSRDAKDIVRGLIMVSPDRRLTAVECLNHKWLNDGSMRKTESDSDHVPRVRRLETAAMRKWLARRRWARACHIIRGTIRMKSVGDTSTNLRPEYHRMRSYGDAAAELLPEYYSSDVEVWI